MYMNKYTHAYTVHQTIEGLESHPTVEATVNQSPTISIENVQFEQTLLHNNVELNILSLDWVNNAVSDIRMGDGGCEITTYRGRKIYDQQTMSVFAAPTKEQPNDTPQISDEVYWKPNTLTFKPV